ncbi:hypothetical protein [Gorillibacterium sp. sgz5001074]|uniref:hypothetical protein n=1 Tax=Gorillibacterium sp. sgz5001074 TaxID=3446695 RepID=UPI003F66831D
MAKDNIQVPFGYEPPVEVKKGTLIVYDDFSEAGVPQLLEIFRFAEDRGFDHVIFYPIHEETGRRMGLELTPYHRRAHQLEELLEEISPQTPRRIRVTLDQWEGKRKKYTPVETALDFLTEKNKGPFFVWMTERLASKWGTYASFPEWIRKVRLALSPPYGNPLPPAMKEYESRWEYVR